MSEGKIRPLLDAVVKLEPPSLGKRLDDLEAAMNLLNGRTSQLRRDLVELRDWVILDKAKGGGPGTP